MTVAELGDRMSIKELEEWAEWSRVKRAEREHDDRIARVEARARANRP